MNKIITLLLTIRAKILRNIKRAPQPLSTKFGYDRGTPIDRFWIETFLKENGACFKGECLEIGDDRYIRKFGNSTVRTTILDINQRNRQATIIADLQRMPNVDSNRFDCIILTHVLGMVEDMSAAVREIYRVLKPGGVVLVTSACIAPLFKGNVGKWHIMPDGASCLFNPVFGKGNVEIKTYGNVYSGQAFWVGMSQEELSTHELTVNDDRFPCIVAVKATKKL